jgi:hypothetical protein
VRALDIERLQLFRREGDELAAFVFIAFAYLVAVDLLACMLIVRPKRDTGSSGGVFRLLVCVVNQLRRPLADIVSSTRPGGLLVFLGLDRLGRPGSRDPDLVQTDGLRATGRRRQVNGAGNQRQS